MLGKALSVALAVHEKPGDVVLEESELSKSKCALDFRDFSTFEEIFHCHVVFLTMLLVNFTHASDVEMASLRFTLFAT